MALRGSVFVYLLWSAVLLSALFLTTSAGNVKIQKKEGYIVDIKISTSNGARLLGGLGAQDMHACVQECVGQEGCDMAVVKLEGYSDTGKNCYLLACTGSCVTAEHNGFTSFLLERRSQSKEDEDVKSESSDEVLKALEVLVNDVLDKDGKETADKVAKTEGKETETKGKETGTEGKETGTEGKETETEGKETETKGKVAKTEGKETETKGKVAKTEGKETGTEGKETETEGKETETEGKETAGDTPLVDGSELPFNPHQSGPEQSHVAAESPKAMVNDGDTHSKGEGTEKDHVDSADEKETDASVQEVLDSLEDEFAKMADDDDTVDVQSIGDENKDSDALNTAPSPNPAGVIVGVVLGGCVLVLVASTVMAVGMRKGWESFKKRKYKKMDYLINGMYS